METQIKTLAENVPPGAGLVSMVKQTTSVRVAVLHFILKEHRVFDHVVMD